MSRAAVICFCLARAMPGAGQQVVDRIAARIQDDIIAESEVRELGSFQQLVQGHAGPPDALLAELISQWIARGEASASNFPRPGPAEVAAAEKRLEKQFSSAEAFRSRLRELDLSASAVGRLLERQIFLARYLDFKFRPAVQVDRRQIERYYREELAAELKARGQTLPPLEDVEDQILELLTQREINRLAARWLEETKSRLKIELDTGGAAR